MADFDLAVVGGGAAGLGAARAGLWEGASVVLISDAPLGGDCTFTGCVPSKSLIEASRQRMSFTEGIDRVSSVVETIAATESAEVLRTEGATVVEARARFVGARELQAGGRRISASKVIVATGSRAMIPSIDGLADTPFLTNESFFDRRSQPESLAIIGGGPIGCELGEAMARFGTAVTILERGARVLNRFEPDASDLVLEGLRASGVNVRTGMSTDRVEYQGGSFHLRTNSGVVVAEELLVATGRVPNTNGLDVEIAGVELDERGHIVTDEWLRTTAKGVFAVGDVNGKQLLSHAADEMGRVAAWTALRTGRRYRFDPLRIPQVVFTTPEVASIGVLEADAPENARVAEAPMHINDRALAADRPEGFVRLIAKRDLLTGHKAGGRLVGATIVGGHAGELINEAAIAMRSGMFAGRLAQTVRAYPSWSTVMQKAAARWFYEVDGEGARPPRR